MGDNRRFPGGGLPRDAAVDGDGKAKVGEYKSYESRYRHNEDKGVDRPLGNDPNAMGHSGTFPDEEGV